MGIREVRRLRGEMGRAMFFEGPGERICNVRKTGLTHGEDTNISLPEIKRIPGRFRNPLGKYRLSISAACDNCGKCVEICPYEVYRKGARKPRVINEQFCLGTGCIKKSFCCIPACPKNAITVRPNPSFEVLGDKRWTPDLLASTWHMAETGEVPHQDLNYKTGDTGGGFDKIRFVFPKENDSKVADETVSTSIEDEPLGRRETESDHSDPLLFRRHVLRLREHRFHALEGEGRESPGHVLLHR